MKTNLIDAWKNGIRPKLKLDLALKAFKPARDQSGRCVVTCQRCKKHGALVDEMTDTIKCSDPKCSHKIGLLPLLAGKKNGSKLKEKEIEKAMEVAATLSGLKKFDLVQHLEDFNAEEETEDDQSQEEDIRFLSIDGKLIAYTEDGKVELCNDIAILGEYRDENESQYKKVIGFKNAFGAPKEVVIDARELSGYSRPAINKLQAEGLHIKDHQREKLVAQYIRLSVSRNIGWHTNKIGWFKGAFVLPKIIIGEINPNVRFFGRYKDQDLLSTSGTHADWSKQIGFVFAKNSRLLAAAALAFAAPLMGILRELTTFGYHFYGPSSLGKTTIQIAAGSICGGSESKHYLVNWDNTEFNIGNLTQCFNNLLLPLDEMHLADAKMVSKTIYTLGNERPRGRGTDKETISWKLTFLSSGELTTEAMMNDAGMKAKTGQLVRMINFHADPNSGTGIYENLHGFSSAHDLSAHLRSTTLKLHGTAIRKFIEHLSGKNRDKHIGDFLRDKEKCRQMLWATVENSKAGQLDRVIGYMSTATAAGMLAAKLKVIPVEPGEFEASAKLLFSDWHEDWGHTGNRENEDIVSNVREFLIANLSKFPKAKGLKLLQGYSPSASGSFRKIGAEGKVESLFLGTEMFRREVCGRMNYGSVKRALTEKGLLVDSKTTRNPNKDGQQDRMYQIKASIFANGEAEK